VPDNLTIRPAQPHDMPAILAMIQELADYEKLSHACIATTELLTQHLTGPDRAAEALIALRDNQPVAYATFFKTFSTFLALPGIYLEDIYVKPPFRRQGIGKSILRHIAQLAVTRNYGRVEWSVLDWNQPSIDFYKSIGATDLNEWTMFRLTGEPLKNFAHP